MADPYTAASHQPNATPTARPTVHRVGATHASPCIAARTSTLRIRAAKHGMAVAGLFLAFFLPSVARTQTMPPRLTKFLTETAKFKPDEIAHVKGQALDTRRWTLD